MTALASAGWATSPGADGLHGDLFRRQGVALFEDAADGCVGLPVLAVEGEAKNTSVRQANAAGALDLEEEQVDRAAQPEQGACGAVGGACFDLPAGPVGQDLAACEAADRRRSVWVGSLGVALA